MSAPERRHVRATGWLGCRLPATSTATSNRGRATPSMAGMRRLLCVRRGGLGDTLLMLPVLRAMRKTAPAASLCLAGAREPAGVLLRFGAVDQAMSSEVLQLWALSTDGEAGARARGALAAFDWIVGDDPGLAVVATAQRQVVVFDPRIEGGPPTAAAAVLLARTGLAGEARMDLLAQRPPAVPDAPIVLHPGSGAERKCLPRASLHALAASLSRLGPVCVVLGPAEIERGAGADWPPAVAVERPRTVDALVDRLLAARAFVGHDSGPTHLAAALQVPTCALFVATDPEVWAPRGAHVRVLTDSPPVRAIVRAVADLAPR